MKYIRAKDGVYEIMDETKYSYISIYGKYIKKDDVIEDGDTIEELCDEFVIFDKEQPNGKLLYYKGFENLKNEFINFENDKCKVEIYGAIWTPKGLIYVAKMNSDGALELL